MASSAHDVSPGKASMEFSDRIDGGVILTPATTENRSENLRPGAVGSLEDQFKNLSVGVSERRDLPAPFHI